jgi:hypothetical protein
MLRMLCFLYCSVNRSYIRSLPLPSDLKNKYYIMHIIISVTWRKCYINKLEANAKLRTITSILFCNGLIVIRSSANLILVVFFATYPQPAFICRDWSMSCSRNSRILPWNQGWQLRSITSQVQTISQARSTGQTGRDSGKTSLASWWMSRASCRSSRCDGMEPVMFDRSIKPWGSTSPLW